MAKILAIISPVQQAVRASPSLCRQNEPSISGNFSFRAHKNFAGIFCARAHQIVVVALGPEKSRRCRAHKRGHNNAQRNSCRSKQRREDRRGCSVLCLIDRTAVTHVSRRASAVQTVHLLPRLAVACTNFLRRPRSQKEGAGHSSHHD